MTFPAGFELIETWWVVFLHHDVLIEMAGVEFFLLGVAAVFALGKRMGLDGRGAFLAAGLYGLTPGFHLAATSCLNDGPAAALVLATFSLVAVRLHPALLLIPLGLGVGVKPTYGYALPGILLFYFILRREPACVVPRRTLAWASGPSSLLVGSFWYLRNWMWFGNPFHPVGSPEKPIFPPPQFGPRMSSLVGNLRDLIDVRIYDRENAYGALVDNIAGWGPVAFACGVIALIAIVRTDPLFRRLSLGFSLSLLTVLLLSIHDAWSLKYVFFFPALLCLAVAKVSEDCIAMFRLACVGLVFQLATTTFPYDLPWRDVRALARQPWQARTAAGLLPEELPANEPLGLFSGFGGEPYLRYGPDLARNVVYLRPQSPEELIALMRRNGLRLMYSAAVSREQASLREECIRRGWLRQVRGHLYART